MAGTIYNEVDVGVDSMLVPRGTRASIRLTSRRPRLLKQAIRPRLAASGAGWNERRSTNWSCGRTFFLGGGREEMELVLKSAVVVVCAFVDV